MSVVLRTKPEIKPEVALSKAVADFQAILTNEERLEFSQRDSAGQPQSDAESAMLLVSRIDADNSKRFSRFLAPKLLSFLDCAHQFTAIIDTFVSANPNLAALVWGGIKVTMLVTSNFAKFFEKLSTLFMEIGRQCPRFKDFGALYPSSPSLQGALCDYYAVVIRICQGALKASRRPGILHFSRSAYASFDRDFKSLQIELETQSRIIRNEISLASQKVQAQEAQLQDVERKQSTLFRKVVGKEFSEAGSIRLQASLRHDQRIRRQIYEELCPLDHTSPWKRARKRCLPGTAIWLQEHSNFLAWLKEKTSSLLWCNGKLGAGKTVASSNIVAHLSLNKRQPETVSYFFCESGMNCSLQARTILGSIARQLLSRYIDSISGDTLEDLLLGSRSLDADEVVDLVKKNLVLGSTSFVVIDGLDQCETEELSRTLRGVQSLLNNFPMNLKIFISSRPEIKAQVTRRIEPAFIITMSGSKINEDIETFISESLDQKLEEEELRLGDPTIIERIQDTLVAGAKGMFLWAFLLIEEICKHDNDDDILRTLEKLPDQLSEVFEMMLKRILARKQVEKAGQVLKWVVGARRPLGTDELREAVTIRQGQKSFSSTSMSNDTTRLVASCGSFLYVDEEDCTVHLVHPAAKQHFLSLRDNRVLDMFFFNMPSLDKELGILCMTYINFKEFTHQLVKTTGRLEVDPLKVVSSVLPERGGLSNKIARQFLRAKRPAGSKTDFNMAKYLRESGTVDLSSLDFHVSNKQWAFFSYAEDNWLSHMLQFKSGSDSEAYDLFCRTVEKADMQHNNVWGSITSYQPPVIPRQSDPIFGFHTQNGCALAWAIANRNLLITKFFFSKTIEREISSLHSRNDVREDNARVLWRRIYWSIDFLLARRKDEELTHFLHQCLLKLVIMYHNSQEASQVPRFIRFSAMLCSQRELLEEDRGRLLQLVDPELVSLLRFRKLTIGPTIKSDQQQGYTVTYKQEPRLIAPDEVAGSLTVNNFQVEELDWLYPFLAIDLDQARILNLYLDELDYVPRMYSHLVETALILGKKSMAAMILDRIPGEKVPETYRPRKSDLGEMAPSLWFFKVTMEQRDLGTAILILGRLLENSRSSKSSRSESLLRALMIAIEYGSITIIEIVFSRVEASIEEMALMDYYEVLGRCLKACFERGIPCEIVSKLFMIGAYHEAPVGVHRDILRGGSSVGSVVWFKAILEIGRRWHRMDGLASNHLVSWVVHWSQLKNISISKLADL